MRLPGKSAARSRKGRTTRRPLDMERMERRELLTTYTVSNNGDSGTGTLRQAILNANGDTQSDLITFKLPANELVITPLTPLPALTNTGTKIDGTTQTNYDPTNGQPLVVLDGKGNQAPGLDLAGGGETVKGLVIGNFVDVGNLNTLGSGAGILLEGSPGDVVQDCYIGTTANGLAAAPNSANGIRVEVSGCTIGGTGVTQRNVISGNGGNGIRSDTNKTVIQGNYIGVGRDGTTKVANGSDGIDLENSVGDQIGGIAAGVGNVIAGNTFDGIFIFVGGSTGDTIQGNFIGTDATGTVAVPNGDAGVFIQSAANVVIGGPNTAGNVISGNGYGIYLLGTNTKNISIAGNKIGVDASGAVALPNKLAGIWVNGGNNSVIGGGNVTLGNIIANNGIQASGPGVEIQSGTNVEILTNSIHDNANGGIFLSPGANGDLPAPVLTSAQTAAGQTEVVGTLSVDPATGAGDNFVIQFFANPAADPAGKFEGQTFLGQTIVTADANGNAQFDVRLTLGTTVGFNITATTTQQVVQNTSEFSAPVPVTPAPTTDLKVTVAPNPSPDLFGTNETYVVTIQNTGTSDDTNVVYTGTIDTNSAFVSAVSSQGTAPTFANNIITANLGTIKAGQSATVTIVVTPISVGTISLLSTAVGDVIDTNPGNNTNVNTPVIVNPSADVAVTVIGTPSPVAAGQTLSFVVTILNNGPSVASSVTVVDTLPSGLTNLNVDPGQGTIVSETGNVLTFDLGDLPIGGSDTITITANAPSTAGLISDTATANSGSVADPIPLNNTSTAQVPVENAVNLGLAVAANPNPATVGAPLTYTIAVSNATDQVTGLVPSAATAAVLTDQLPAGIDPNSVHVVASQGTFTIANGVVTINLGTIQPNQSPPIVTITVTPLTSGTYVNTATISDTVEINTNTTATTVTTTVLASPSDLSVSITTSAATATLGSPLTYFVTVTNKGPADAPGTVAIDQVAAGVAVKGVATSQGTFTIAGQRITANLGTIPAGKTATIAIVVVPSLSGPINDIAGVASTNVDPNPSDNVVANTTLVSPADLLVGAVSSTKVPTVGDPFLYAFTVFNAGPAPAANAGLNIVLPAGAAYAGSQTSQGFTGAANGVLSAAFGTLAPDTFATVFVTLIPTAIGVEKATATAFSSNYDPNPGNNVATISTTSNNFPGIFQLSSTSFAGGENAGTIPIAINRLNGTLGAIDVTYTTVAGSAQAGTNFTPTSGTVVFAAGETTKTILVPVKDDGVITGNLNFYFAITGADHGASLGSPAAAVVTVINTDRDLVPPEVTAVVPITTGAGVAGYVVDFSKAVDPTRASNPANYTLFASGRDAGTGNTFIPVSAVYDAANHAVILVPSQPLAQNAFYGLMINGSTGTGLTDLSGNVLDGDGDGAAGGYYAAYVGIGNHLNYVDSGGNVVSLASVGSTMLVTRSFSGDPYSLEVLGAVPGHASLAASVHRVGSSSGVTGIGEISGLGPFGAVNTNGLTSPSIFAASSVFTPALPVPQSIAAAEFVGQTIPTGPRYVLTRLGQVAAAAARRK